MVHLESLYQHAQGSKSDRVESETAPKQNKLYCSAYTQIMRAMMCWYSRSTRNYIKKETCASRLVTNSTIIILLGYNRMEAIEEQKGEPRVLPSCMTR